MTFTYWSNVLPTPKAALALGISVSTLNRYASEEVCIFEEGEHWRRRTPHPRATKLFDLAKCVTRLQSLGYVVPSETLEALSDGN